MFKLIETSIEVFGWLKIAASPLIIGSIIGGFLYLNNPTPTILYIAILIALLGLVVGVIWATRVWKKEGTINFLSKTKTPSENKQED